MKILHVVTSLGRGGAEKLLVDFLPRYVQLGHDITIIQLSSIISDKDYIKAVKDNGIKLVTLSEGGFRNPLLLIKLKKEIQKNESTIVHFHLFPSLYLGALLRQSFPEKKFVYTEHSNNNSRRKYAFLKPIELYMYTKYDAIIAITDNVKSSLQKWIGDKKEITVINNGVDTRSIAQIPTIDKVAICSELDINPSCHLLLMAASFRYPKDQSSLVKLMALLGKNYHLLLAGEGPLQTEVKAESIALNVQKQVHFLGFRNDVKSLMKSVDINILSSAYEGMSGVTLESIAAGKPFLGSNVQGINDLVPDSRFLFENDNIVALAAYVKSIIKDPLYANELNALGINFVKKYDVQIMIGHHLSLYHRLLKKD